MLDATDALPSSFADQHRIECESGVGGMAAVCLARDVRLADFRR
jgi:hypothetical protein